MRDEEGAALADESARIEALLEEIEASAGRPVWQKVEQLVQRLVALYGAGLGRLLRIFEAEGALGDGARSRLCADDLVSSLLLLHGLHPVPLGERVEQALEEVRPYLRSHAGGVELVAIQPDGRVRLRLVGGCRGCPSSRSTVEQAIERAVFEAAPEVVALSVETDAPAGDPAAGALVQIDVRRSNGQAPQARWTPVDGPALAPGEHATRTVGGVHVLLLHTARRALLAYRNLCPACGASFEGATIDEELLGCQACGRRYDLGRAGRSVGSEHDPPLHPLPLLVDEAGARIALPGAGA